MTECDPCERLRVAVVGGGVSGLSTALHLAPLVRSGLVDGPVDVFETSFADGGRDIGVGIWSTGMDPFADSSETSHQNLYQELVAKGSFVQDVGYRSPNGHWLATSSLDGDLPDLLFLKEKDLLDTLRKAVKLEEAEGAIGLHQDSSVQGVDEESSHLWSAQLQLQGNNSTLSARDYHLIVAADGMNSVIRQKYGGYVSTRGKQSVGDSPLELEGPVQENWQGQAEATGVQDRNYTVFRGNSPLSMEEVGIDKSFQTWGEGKSMRFATVPLSSPNADGTMSEQHVWFITIDDETIVNEPDPVQRRSKLLEAFRDWHDPIVQLVASTPADEILMERAIAHKHSMTPVTNFNGIVSRMLHKPILSEGSGPAIVFVGDAFMTVDPILAQGFTIGMEGAAALKDVVESSVRSNSRPELGFCPYALRQQLRERHDSRISRLIHLLRATELVQALGQPTSGTLLGGLSRDILRPLMRLAPDFIKTPIFNSMLLYSLGLTGAKKK